MSKAGLEMLTKSAALELASKGVRVNCVSPSFVPTGFWKNQANLTPLEMTSLIEKERDTNPMKRECMIEEVCDAIIHLCSQHAKMITGQVITVDGRFRFLYCLI
jgi:NAD(P)-dependent dehydrogenase (short-subunit alcohol dehydrogenase family)